MLETYILPTGPAEGASENIKPSISVLEANDDYARVALEPLVPGFAHTIGNPLRRFLLSSIRGSAITWVKIDNVVHEYTAIQGVKEEVMDLLLNIKRIRIHADSERTGKMRLDVQGEGRVCAGDIATSSDFEIVNPSRDPGRRQRRPPGWSAPGGRHFQPGQKGQLHQGAYQGRAKDRLRKAGPGALDRWDNPAPGSLGRGSQCPRGRFLPVQELVQHGWSDFQQAGPEPFA